MPEAFDCGEDRRFQSEDRLLGSGSGSKLRFSEHSKGVRHTTGEGYAESGCRRLLTAARIAAVNRMAGCSARIPVQAPILGAANRRPPHLNMPGMKGMDISGIEILVFLIINVLRLSETAKSGLGP